MTEAPADQSLYSRAPWVLFVHAMRRMGLSLRWHLVLGLLLVAYFVALLLVEYSTARIGAPGLELYRRIAYLNLVMISIAGAGCFSVCVASERDAGTLDLLRLAGLGPLGFLVGRWLPLVVTTALLLLLQVPCTSFAVTLGGVLPDRIRATTVATLVHLLLVASVGLLISVFSKTSQRAVLTALAVFGLWFAGPDIFEAAALQMWPASAARMETLFEQVRLYSAFGSLERIDRTAWTGLSFWGVEQTWQLFAAIVALVISGCFFERPSLIEPVAQRTPTIRSDERGPHRWMAGAAALFDKDFRLVGGGFGWVALRLFAYPVVGIAYVRTVGAFNDWMTWALIHETALRMIGWDTAITLSQLFQREVREQTWGGLLLLPISRRRLCYSKLAGALAALSPGWAWALYASVRLASFNNSGSSLLDVTYFASIALLGIHVSVLASVLVPRVSWTIPMLLGVAAAHLQLEVSRYLIYSFAFGGPYDRVVWVLLIGSLSASAVLHIVTVWRVCRLTE